MVCSTVCANARGSNVAAGAVSLPTTGGTAMADTVTADAGARRPGRPRNAALEERVLQVVIDLIDAGVPVTVGVVVERSGVSRSAIYRRWATFDMLISAALDEGRVVIQPPEHLTMREALRFGFPKPGQPSPVRYPEERLRQRFLLTLTDRDLQHEYWKSHVSRRRAPLKALLEQAQEQGQVRTDVDLDAALDLLSGVFYYQILARGADLNDAATLERCSAAMDIIWDGIVAQET